MIETAYQSSESKARYNAKTYKAYTLQLKLKEDQQIIKHFETERAKGKSAADIVRTLYYKSNGGLKNAN